MPPPPHLVLDPRRASGESAGEFYPRKSLPRHIRDFGYVPDESQILPGDLVLFSALEPSLVSRAIIKSQTVGGYNAADARWHHVACYLGDMRICEAQIWKGVRITELYDYVGEYLLRVRRDPSLSTDERWQLALQCVYELRKAYGFLALPRLWYQSKRGFWHHNIRQKSAIAMVCSDLYSKAYALTTGRLLVKGSLNITIPADLSSTPCLNDMPVSWRRIVEVPIGGAAGP